jgi:glycosyltransferase involved in cell wall biosynthesis
MNVLFVIHYPVFGGPHNQALLLAREMPKLKVHMTILLPNDPGNATGRLHDGGVDVVSIPLRRLRASADPRTHLKLAMSFRGDVGGIRRIIRDRSIDVVQIGGLVNPHAAVAGRLEGAAVVWQLLDTRPPQALRRLMMPLVTRLSDVVMTTGRAVARAHPGAEVHEDRLFVFFPPVDPNAFSPATWDQKAARAEFGFEPHDSVVGAVGNLNPQKGYEFLLRGYALARAKRPGVRLLIVGASHDTHRSYERRLLRLARDLGLVVGHDVVFAGGRADVRPAFAAMDVFVLSSVPRSEGAPTVIEEAMTMQVPVIATDVGAVSELVVDGETGYVIPPSSSERIAETVLRVLGDPGLRHRMGICARERALACFATEECVGVHIQAYERALAHRRASRSGKA